MICKTCNSPVYPSGVSYTGPSCSWNGDHPSMPDKWNDGYYSSREPVTLTDGPKYEHMLTQPLKDLTAAVMELAKIIQNQTK